MTTNFGYVHGTTEICNVYVDGKDGRQYRAFKHNGTLWTGCKLTKNGNWEYLPGRKDQDSWNNALIGYI